MPHVWDAQLCRKLPVAGPDPLRHAVPLVVQMHQETTRTKAELISLASVCGDWHKSAHDRRYDVRRIDIDKVKDDLRTVVEELIALARLK